MRRFSRIPAFLTVAALAFVLSGCGAMVARARIVGAQSAVAAAKRAHADRHSPYEYTGALLFLEKAREQEAYGRYGNAVEFGGTSEELAEKARLHAVSADHEAPPAAP